MVTRTSHIEINPKKADPAGMYKLEQILYGTQWTEPRLPLPDEIISFLSVRHGDDWLGGIFPLFDNVSFPHNGTYEEIVDDYFPRIDKRRF